MDNKQAALELGTKPVGGLLMQYALPAIVAMTASSLYNIIDRAFIGQVVGPEAIAGLGITFPLMNLGAAFGAAVGVGASTSISVKLGQKDYKRAQNLLGNTVTLNLIIGLLFMAVCLLFLNPILRFFGASDVTLPYAREFMIIILLGNVVTHMYFGMNAVLRAAGKPRHAMYATLFTVACNIVLVIAFVWWFRWGIRGAALATVTSQSLALCWQMWVFSDKKELLHLRRGIYRLRPQLVKNIIAIGISPFLMQATSCIIVVFMNNQFVHYGGDMAVGAYSIANSHPAGRLGTVDALPQRDCPHLYHRPDVARTVGTRHPARHAGILRRRFAGCHHQFLPVYRQGEGVHLPLAVAPALHAAADGLFLPPCLGAGWCVVFDACQRLGLVCHDHTYIIVVS